MLPLAPKDHTMTEQDYRTADAPSLPVQPAHLPAAPTVATLPTQPVPADPVTAEPQVVDVAPAAVAPVAEPVAQPVAQPVAEPVAAAVYESVAESVATEDAAPKAPSRPASASRKARRPAGGARKVTRYTLDLESQQHLYLRMFAISNGLEASKVMRGLLFLLEAGNELPGGVTLADLLLDEIFADEEE